MSIASIDLARMADLVTAMETAAHDVAESSGVLRGSLSAVHLPTESLTPAEDVQGWIDEQLPGVRRRLAIAQAIESATPGIQLDVEIDESDISTATPEEAREDAARAAELISEYDEGNIPDSELVELLEQNANDPYFAHELALRVGPEAASELILEISSTRDALVLTDHDGDLVDELDATYDPLLTGLGQAFGLATRGSGDLQLPEDYTQAWLDAIVSPLDPAHESSQNLGQPGALGLIISRGNWSTDFLTQVTEGVYFEELRRNQPGMWQEQASDGFGEVWGPVQPGGGQYFDPMASLLTAVGRNPDAGHYLFGGGMLTDIEVEGETVQVNGFLNYLIATRHWPMDNAAGAQSAIATAMIPFPGGDTISAEIAMDARAVIAAKQAEIEARGEDRNWFSEIGHLVLDGLGLFPFVGEPADAINAVWYTAEGDMVNAALSSAAMVPFAGWAAAAARAPRHADNVADLAGAANRITRSDLNPRQLANLNRYTKKLPAGAEDTIIVQGADNAVVLTTKVPGRIPGSYALYTKVIDEAGTTVGYTKTTVAPDGSIVHIKDKMAG